MTEQELARLIAAGEGPYLEFKATQVRPATLARTLIAFANSGGGQGRRTHYTLVEDRMIGG